MSVKTINEYANELEADLAKAECDASHLRAELVTLREEVEGLHATIGHGWKRTVEANNLWRRAHPGNDLVMCDLGDLLTWLMDEAGSRRK